MTKLRVYTLSNCDTCRKAVKWLKARGLELEERPIRDMPPSVLELKAMLKARDGDLRRLFNTAGREYRELKLSETLPSMREADALKLLAGNGSLVKRPFLIGDGVAVNGFDSDEWSAALAAHLCPP